MKKTLMLGALALIGFGSAYAESSLSTVEFLPKTDWSIKACTEASQESNGNGYAAKIIDDNTGTYWHSNWTQCNESNKHWFLIDRGTDANANEFDACYFVKRSGGGTNGVFETVKVFVTDTDPELVGNNTAADNDKIAAILAGDATVEATLSTTDGNKQYVKFSSAQTGRYIIVVPTKTIGDAENKFASLAEFGLVKETWKTPEAKYISGAETLYMVRNDRRTTQLVVSGVANEGGSVTIAPLQQQNSTQYQNIIQYDYTSEFTVTAYAGTTVTVTPSAAGSYMQNYLFVDWDNDGFTLLDNKRDYLAEDGYTIKDGVDVVAYSRSSASGKWLDMTGAEVNGASSMSQVLSFTIPADTPSGTYRVRYKVEWDNLKPVPDSSIADDGGIVVDFLLKVDNSIALTLTFKNSETDANPLVETVYVDRNATEFPVYDAFTCVTTGTIAENNKAATYVLKAGTEFRIYNERVSKYVYIKDVNGTNKLYQTTATDDPTSVFYMIPMGTDCYALYSKVKNQFVGNIGGTNSETVMADFSSTPKKYYIGKQNAPDDYMSWIGTRDNDGGNLPYTAGQQPYFFNENNGNYVCGYGWADGGSRWVVVTNPDEFAKNWALRADLIESVAGYQPALSILSETDEDGLAAWANAYNFGGDVNVPVSAENQTKIEKMKNTVDRAAEHFPVYMMESGKLFTITSNDNRGALIYDEAQSGMFTTAVRTTTTTTNDSGEEQTTTTETINAADPQNDNHLWGFVKVDNKYYLYNQGAKKFASAYILRQGLGNATYAWSLSDIPTAVTLDATAYGKSVALNDSTFTILGGRDLVNNRPGMMIINANATRVPCMAGNNSATDGCGFRLTMIKDADLTEEMAAAVATGFAKANDEVSALGEKTNGYVEEEHANIVGHYSATAAAAFNQVVNAAKENADKETAYYDVLDATRTLERAESRVAPVNGYVYTIADVDGIHHVALGGKHTTTTNPDPVSETDNSHNWLCSVAANGAITLTHTVITDDAPQGISLQSETAIPFALGEVNSFKVAHTDTLGQVNLLNAADNAATDDKHYVMTLVSTDASAATTGIFEITADGNAAEGAIYDLRGRRLAAPVKGSINIINGRKVLVK